MTKCHKLAASTTGVSCLTVLEPGRPRPGSWQVGSLFVKASVGLQVAASSLRLHLAFAGTCATSLVRPSLGIQVCSSHRGTSQIE